MEPETVGEPEVREELAAGEEQSCTVYGLYDQDLTHKVNHHQIIKGFLFHTLPEKKKGAAQVQFPPQGRKNGAVIYLVVQLCFL